MVLKDVEIVVLLVELQETIFNENTVIWGKLCMYIPNHLLPIQVRIVSHGQAVNDTMTQNKCGSLLILHTRVKEQSNENIL